MGILYGSSPRCGKSLVGVKFAPSKYLIKPYYDRLSHTYFLPVAMFEELKKECRSAEDV